MLDNKFLIALIEDDLDQTFLVKRALTEWMSLYEIESFTTGQDFFAGLNERFYQYDAIIVDYMLPKLSGLDILKRLRELGFDRPVVFLTVSDDKNIIHEALQYGAYDYVLKKEGYLTTLPVILFKSIDRYRCQRHHEEVQEQVHKLKEYFENILNTVPFAILGINCELEISYANCECQKMFFMDPSEIIGKTIFDLFDPQFVAEIDLIDHIKKVKDALVPISLHRVKYINSKHERKFLDLELFRTITELGEDALLLISDVTASVELEQKLVQTEKLASLGKLLTGITHELNNRMGPILAYSQLLMACQQDMRSIKWLKSIEESAQSVKAIVESLLYFSTATTHQNREKVNLNELIENTLTLVKYKFQSKNIKIIQEFDDKLPVIQVDRKQISRVFLNILNNSYEAMSAEGGELRISSSFTDKACQIEIEDTGSGIPEEIMNDIFDPFFTTKSDKQNLGLGLSIAYNLLQNHNGAIHISSREGSGTRVTLTLPHEEVFTAESVRPFEIKSTEKLSRVLIIEDDENLRNAMKDILEDGYEVDIAENGDGAVTRIVNNEYNAILADIRMPGMDGPALYHWVKEHFPGLERRMVFTTGDTYDPDTNKFLDSIENSCLSKPFNINDLKNLIKKVIT